MKKSFFKGIALMALALIVLIGFSGCPSGSTGSSGGGSGSGGGTVSPAVPEGFVEVSTTPNGETTTETASTSSSTNPTVSNENYWKGVFTTGRKVKLSPYAIGETEVTYELWREVYNWAVGDAGGEGQPKEKYVFAKAGKAGSHGQEGTANNPLPLDDTNKKHPVTTVSWQDCVVWCNAYTEKTKGLSECVYRKGDGDETVIRKVSDATPPNLTITQMKKNMKKKGFRLPTEAEWEWAARYQASNSINAVAYGSNYLTKLNSASGASAAYDDATETGKVAWYNANSGNKTHPVGTKEKKNALGLFDMSGNVWEWCFDRMGSHNEDPTSNDAATYTVNGNVEDPLGVASGSYRVGRGGGWNGTAVAARLAVVTASVPTTRTTT